jgi:hypothetical protein
MLEFYYYPQNTQIFHLREKTIIVQNQYCSPQKSPVNYLGHKKDYPSFHNELPRQKTFCPALIHHPKAVISLQEYFDLPVFGLPTKIFTCLHDKVMSFIDLKFLMVNSEIMFFHTIFSFNNHLHHFTKKSVAEFAR